MDLIRQYREYVKWCDEIDTYPIGFVKWKGKKFDYTWDSKKHVYIKNK
jgi:hypothetical protein